MTDSGCNRGRSATAPEREKSSTLSTVLISRRVLAHDRARQADSLGLVPFAAKRERFAGDEDLRKRHSKVV
jgi:hypothetical protein